ncbi:hypothetical protein PCE1_003159 [Barthelona sp. PCE]
MSFEIIDFLNTKPDPLTLLSSINAYLEFYTYIGGDSVSLQDIIVYDRVKNLKLLASGRFGFVERWLQHITTSFDEKYLDEIRAAVFAVKMEKAEPNKEVHARGVGSKTEVAGSMPELEHVPETGVVTRFAPEPSGFMHIGHLKALMISDYYARKYNGKLILRFDDTNPSKEKAEFVDNLINDIESVHIKPDETTHTSTNFAFIEQCALKLINDGLAYMDDTVDLKTQRANLEASPHRDTSPEVNLERFRVLQSGSEEGQRWCLRAKIDHAHKVGLMRDPVIYRYNGEPHLIYGDKYKAYPTYDLACPVIDSIEGVTHAMRSSEYHERDAQYMWFLEKLELRIVHIVDFSRLNFNYTIMSKRSLKELVEEEVAEGWNDPRFPTIQGLLRRGMTVESLRQFILGQGCSKKQNTQEWEKLYTVNKQNIDNDCPRYLCVPLENSIELELSNIDSIMFNRPFNRHNPELGNRDVPITKKMLLPGLEKDIIPQNKNQFTMIGYSGCSIESREEGKIVASVSDEIDPRKPKNKLQYVSVDSGVEVKMIFFDHLITIKKLKDEDWRNHVNPESRFEIIGLAEPAVANLKVNDMIQFERVGYFRLDHIDDNGQLVFYNIPDGKLAVIKVRRD